MENQTQAVTQQPGQPVAQGEQVATNVVEGGPIGYIDYAFEAGGWPMFLIALIFFLSIIISIERLIKHRRFKVSGPSLIDEVRRYIMDGDLDGAIRVCEGAKGTALSYVLRAGLVRASTKDQTLIQNSLSASLLELVPKIEARIPYLALFANIATLVGLFGTIVGMITTFEALGAYDAALKAQKLSEGISHAMFCTAFGLITAIFSMVLNTVLSVSAEHIIGQLNEHAVKLLNLLGYKRIEHAATKRV